MEDCSQPPPADAHDDPDFASREGNELRLLINGDEIFPAMLQAIREARQSVNLETFVYWAGEIAEEFAQSLAEAARRGVAVRVVLDWFGSQDMRSELIETMAAGGVEVRHFRPLQWFNLRRSNRRTHRKLLVVDGRIAFTGGVGIAEEWTGDAQDSDHFRDNHYEVRGPVVADLQQLFFAHWDVDDVPSSDDEAYYPVLEKAGSVSCRVIAAEPDKDSNEIEELYLQLLRSARQRFCAVAPYFAPSDQLLDELAAAAERGVEVQVIAAGRNNDKRVVRKAFRNDWGPLLKAGVRIHEYHRTLIHVKMLLVDDRKVLVGSANFDVRSLCINSEASLLIEDSDWAEKHAQVFADDLADCEEATLADWENRSWSTKAKDKLSHLLRDFL
ncbi:phospholipase D-like domain-containing protein [Roseibacillus persicicus]|uniref:Cardiolipin synthase B n=1 Tax=Roseibacillus persicicus TaxID=454148 RepID=A0A918TIC1_9BACT|nr:phospholipase D-like domain-containing protein [Roseibacillus persicicus]GHC43472.1 cardiolipin synthase B [Roseibacillus persicicus]